jgi:hypothetical protein
MRLKYYKRGAVILGNRINPDSDAYRDEVQYHLVSEIVMPDWTGIQKFCAALSRFRPAPE